MSIPIIPSSVTLPSFADVYGAALVGSWVAMGLYGLTTTQAYIYWVHYPKDSPWTKSLVAFLWVLGTIHSICMCHATYFHLIKVESDILVALSNIWSFNAAVLLYIISYITVTIYYINMIFQLSSDRFRWWLTGILALPALSFLALALDTCIHGFISPTVIILSEIAHDTIMPGFALQCVSDGSITISLCLLLYGKRTSFQRTRHILNNLIIYAASRGLITLLVTLVMVLAIAINPDQMWYGGIQFALVGLYTNSLMTMLNARRPSSDTTDASLEYGMNQKSHFGASGGKSENNTSVDIVVKKPANVEFIVLGRNGTNNSE